MAAGKAPIVRGLLFVIPESQIVKPIRSWWYVVLGIAPGQSGVAYRSASAGILMYQQFRQPAAQAAALSYLAEYVNGIDVDNRKHDQECATSC